MLFRDVFGHEKVSKCLYVCQDKQFNCKTIDEMIVNI